MFRFAILFICLHNAMAYDNFGYAMDLVPSVGHSRRAEPTILSNTPIVPIEPKSVVEIFTARGWTWNENEWDANGLWTCDGVKQSPIHIDTRPVNIVTDHQKAVKVQNVATFDEPMIGVSDGHQLRVVFPETSRAELLYQTNVSSAAPPTLYTLDEAYFSWGEAGEDGSSHSLGPVPDEGPGTKTSAELTILFRREGTQTLEEASRLSHGVIAVAIRLREVPDLTTRFDWIPDLVESLNARYEETNVFPVAVPFANIAAIDCLPPIFDKGIYLYEGSQQQPACTENVTYLVMERSVDINSNQLGELRKLLGIRENGSIGPLTSAGRGIQPRNQRNILRL